MSEQASEDALQRGAMTAAHDQFGAHMAGMAQTLGTLFQGLLDGPFERDEALLLTRDWWEAHNAPSCDCEDEDD